MRSDLPAVLGTIVVLSVVGGILWYQFVQKYAGRPCGSYLGLCPVGYSCYLDPKTDADIGLCKSVFK